MTRLSWFDLLISVVSRKTSAALKYITSDFVDTPDVIVELRDNIVNINISDIYQIPTVFQ